MSAVTVSSQTRTLTRNLTWEVIKSVAIAAIIGAVVSLAVFLLATSQGWLTEGAGPVLEIDGESVTLASAEFGFTWFGLPAAAATITAFVMAIILAASYVRIPIAHGATRTALVNSHLLTGLVSTGVITLFGLGMAVLDHVANVQNDLGVAEIFAMGDGVGAVLLATLKAFVMLLSAYAFGLAIGIVFIRFPWWVGVAALVFLMVIVPLITEALRWEWADGFLFSRSNIGLLDVLSLVLFAGAFAWMVKTLEVD